LSVTFYAEDVFRVWQKWTAQGVEPLVPGIEIALDGSSRVSSGLHEFTSGTVSGIQAIDVGYSSMKEHLEKARDLLANSPRCTICSERLPPNGAMTLVCPNNTCRTAGHLTCLAPSFLADNEDLVPTTGKCPGCGTKLHWIDLVKELSLRMRGEAEVQKIFKVRKPRGTKKDDAVAATTAIADDASEDENIAEEDLPYLSVSDDSETDDDAPARNDYAMPNGRGFQASNAARGAAPFIEDSDWDDAEIVT
jgi:structure-specific endonuclease subunit SLX1